jgi:hypothetical protein
MEEKNEKVLLLREIVETQTNLPMEYTLECENVLRKREETHNMNKHHTIKVSTHPYYVKAFSNLENVELVDDITKADIILKVSNIAKMWWFNNCIFRSFQQVDKILGNKSKLYKLLSRHVSMPKTKDVTFLKNGSSYWNAEIKAPLFKPTSKSCGRGITFNKKELDIYTKYIAQEYIESPMLYNGRKFDIRIMVGLMGSQNYIIDEDALVRLSKFAYDNDDKTNMLIHLTNVSQQNMELEITNDNFMLKSYSSEMYNEICTCIETIIKHVKPILKINYFGVWGLDFIFDSSNKLYLLEINTRPGIYAFPEEHYIRFLNRLMKLHSDSPASNCDSLASNSISQINLHYYSPLSSLPP